MQDGTGGFSYTGPYPYEPTEGQGGEKKVPCTPAHK